MPTLRGLDEVERNLDKWYQGRLHKARIAMEEICSILESYAKTNHPWRTQTGATIINIRAFIAEATPTALMGVLTAGMSYNVFLELAREGKWAWLWPAVEANLPMIKRKLDGIME